jgi:hypothetical protein
MQSTLLFSIIYSVSKMASVVAGGDATRKAPALWAGSVVQRVIGGISNLHEQG